MSSILEAVAISTDIPPRDIERLIGVASNIIDKPDSRPEGWVEEYLIGMSMVMANHPSPKNEDLLIKMLQVRPNGRGTSIKMMAGEALGTCGSTKAIPAVRAAANSLWNLITKDRCEDCIWMAKRLDIALVKLETRHEVIPTVRTAPTNLDSTAPAKKIAGEGHAQLSWFQPSISSAIIVALASIALIRLFWLTLKTRK